MIDLHTHSTFSDGSLTPEQLVAAAEQIGLTALALTDHDTVGGWARLLAAGAGRRVCCVAGVELSAEFHPGTLHLLGYFID
ncbi:MAG: PHP domain-containing protein, partial [Kiritimatiellaeota bacterium]|nr:PHP domain-containing protein [Kiritimatiellota bacterium]